MTIVNVSLRRLVCARTGSQATDTHTRHAGKGIWSKGNWPFSLLEGYAAAAIVSVAIATYITVTGDQQNQKLMQPVSVVALMVANLVPTMALIMLVGRRVARARAAQSLSDGKGRLHVRLVGLFSMIAALPTLLVVIFASLLFQMGIDFWFSDKSRGMFENAAGLAEGYYRENQQEVEANTIAMSKDISAALRQISSDSSDFSLFYLQQVVIRNLNRSEIIEIGKDGVSRRIAMIDPSDRESQREMSQELIRRLDSGEKIVTSRSGHRIESVTKLDAGRRAYLFASRDEQVMGLSQLGRAKTVLNDYNALFERSQQLQVQFNLALYVGSLLIVALAVIAAILLADRIVRPLGRLVSAARTAAGGDLSVRVKPSWRDDEIAVLARAFNSMTEQLQGQTSALLLANEQLETRRNFIETVLSGVSSAVLSLDTDRRIQLANAAALEMTGLSLDRLVGQRIDSVLPELSNIIDNPRGEAVVLLTRAGGESATVAAKSVALDDGQVLSFEDITQQLDDQRHAAWSDVARRIAHEIKNPLTPIQLAAERLQRRFGAKLTGDSNTFRTLTDTIIRQVNDIRRMVNEFSSFARMPKPTFGEEDLIDIVRRSVFLFQVSRPDIEFVIDSAELTETLICDRQLLSQAVTNVIKNAAEAIDEKQAAQGEGALKGKIRASITSENKDDLVQEEGFISIIIDDNGIGLPDERDARDAIVDPYVTTRKGGTGLGLTIVKKIVEDHLGKIEFSTIADGGTRVKITLWPAQLEQYARENPCDLDTGVLADSPTSPQMSRCRFPGA